MKLCTCCSVQFEITDRDREFYKKVDVPEPTLCPDCRQQRRLAFRNERKLYKTTCGLCKKSIISVYSPDKPFPVYCTECWWSDQWDAMQYGRNFDFTRPFFEQWKEIWDAVPKIALIVLGDCVNSEYIHDAYRLKNCYLTFDGEQAEDCLYGETFIHLKNCVDFLFLEGSQMCYECINCMNCYQLTFSRFCKTCSESSFLVDCIGCKHCLGCVNLYQKEYHIFNEPYSKANYEKKVAELGLHHSQNLRKFRKEFEAFSGKQIKKAFRGIMNEKVSGDNIVGCKDTFDSYDAGNLRDCRFCTNIIAGGKDCYDVNIWGDNLELAYNCACVGAGCQSLRGCYYVGFEAKDIFHSAFCWHNAHDLLGCVALKHKKYCILNKQYSEEEYRELFSKIKKHMLKAGEWGEFFPPQASAFGYNETVAQEYYPSTKEEVLEKGWEWYDEPEPDFSGVTKKIPATKLPDTIEKIPEDILNWAISCEESDRPFRIQKAELDFYRQMDLPIPHFYPDIRHRHRQQLRNPRRLWKRNCGKCQKEIQTTYAPERTETVYCEECYTEAVF